MGSKAVVKSTLLSDYYVDGKDALNKAHSSQGGSSGLLRRTARSIADAGTYDTGSSAPTSSDDETDALTRFARKSGLMRYLRHPPRPSRRSGRKCVKRWPNSAL
jgi:hypothetical protein